jgi:predicted amidohydrolase YtcJ
MVVQSADGSARAARATDREPADRIVLAPVVRTMDPAQPLAQFVAIRGDRIVAVGPRDEADAWTGPRTERLEYGAGTCVVPGFVESHAHLFSLGESLRRLDLVGTKSFDEVVARTVARAKSSPDEAWIRGRGWDQNDWPDPAFPTHAKLSAALPDRPVCLERVDGHAVLVNAAALRAAGVDARTVAPSGGEIVKDARGEPTGVLVDAATTLVTKAIPPPSDAELEQALALALQACAREGITTFVDAGEDRRSIELLVKAARERRLTTRIHAMLDGSDAKLLDEWFARGRFRAPDGFLTIRSVKVYADGALGSRGALLLADYADRPGHRGLAQVDEAALEKLTRRALDAGFQVCTHAIGDGANRLVLDAYERALLAWRKDHPDAAPDDPRVQDARLRVEHAQLVAPEDLPRFARLGVIASMQTCHCTSDAPWVPARIGDERARREAYVWRSVLDSKARFCNGTDAPVEPLSVLRNLYSAVTRLDPDGRLAQPFFAEQRLTPDEALASATRDGAFACFAEEDVGTLQAGRLADLVVLSCDPVAGSPRAWLDARVVATVVAGRRL